MKLGFVSAILEPGSYTHLMGADGGKRYVTVFTVLIIIAILTGSFLLKEINIPRIPESQSMSLKNCAGDFKAFLTNRYFLILVVYGGLLMLSLIHI